MAESPNTGLSAVHSYHIQAGLLEDALKQFSEQSGIKLAFDPALLQGKVTFGLEGAFEVKQALERLLENSGLQVVQLGERLAITPITAASDAEQVVTLPSIQISASATNRYAATSTSTATKTNTLLRDVPQAITVITGDLIKDQSIRSLADAVRYVPGVGISQGEGNRDALVFRGNRSTGDFFIDGLRRCRILS